MPPDTFFSFFSPTRTRSHTLPPTKKHTLQATCAWLCNCAWTACAGRGKKRCVGVAREKKAAATRARAHGRPPIFFPSWLRHQAAGGRALFLCRDPARRSSSHRLPSRAHAGEGGPGPGPPPATSHSRGGPCVPGWPDTPHRDTHTRAHPFLLFTLAFSTGRLPTLTTTDASWAVDATKKGARVRVRGGREASSTKKTSLFFFSSYSDGRTADFFTVPPFNKRTLPP